MSEIMRRQSHAPMIMRTALSWLCASCPIASWLSLAFRPRLACGMPKKPADRPDMDFVMARGAGRGDAMKLLLSSRRSRQTRPVSVPQLISLTLQSGAAPGASSGGRSLIRKISPADGIWAGVLFNSQCSDGILLASMLPSMGTRLGVMRGETGVMPGEYGICGISGAVGGGGAARFGSLRGGGGSAASASFDRTSMSCTAVRLRLRSQARWRSRQCLRTASRDAYSLSHPGCLHTKRERSPVMRILQQLTARTLLSAEGGCVGFGLGGDFLIVGVMATQGAGGVVIVSSVMA